MNRLAIITSLILVMPTLVLAQSFNVDFGEPDAGPASTYAAAGLPGVWNSIRAEHTAPFTPGPTPDDYLLVDLHGNQTGVGFHNYGGLSLELTDDPSVSGDDASLLTDYLVTHSATLETCLYLNGLQNGIYEMLTYAWMPQSPSTEGQVRFDALPGQLVLVGGAWPGAHEEGVTYARHVLDVSDGHIGWHVGIPAGGNTVIGAAANGFQLRKLPPWSPGDLNCDGTLDGEDIPSFVQAFLDPDGYPADHPTCNIANADLDGNMAIEDVDIELFVSALLAS